MNTIYLSLGSNIGSREEYITQALQRLQEHEHILLIKCSSFYETDPVGVVNQAVFLNVVVQGQTTLTPHAFLAFIHEVERDFGRTRDIRWGPRVIDIDILLYNNIRIHSDDLVIPHPRMTERSFVLVPLAEIAPDLILFEKSIQKRIQAVGKEGVRLWKTN